MIAAYQSFSTRCPDEWQAHVCNVYTQLSLQSVDTANFVAEAKERQVGSLLISDIVAGGQKVCRERRQIEALDNKNSYLLVQKTGSCVVSSSYHAPIKLRAQDAYLVDTKKPYSLEFNEASEQLCITVPCEELRYHSANLCDSIAGNKLDGSSSVARILQASLADLNASRSDNYAESMACVDFFYQILVGCFRRQLNYDTSDNHDKKLNSFNSLTNYIANNYCEITVADAANALGTSVRSLQRLCCEFGVTFRKLVIESRLVAARHMLSESHLNESNIAEIAFNLGFSDQSHFNRVFKEKFGVSPKVFSKGLVNIN